MKHLYILFFFSNLAFAQVSKQTHEKLRANFKAFDITVPNVLYKKNANDAIELSLQVEGQAVDFILYKNNLLSKDYKVTIGNGPDDVSIKNNTSTITTSGYNKDYPNRKAYFTFAEDFIGGSFEFSNQTYYVEPLRLHDKSAKHQVVVYKDSDVIKKETTCLSDLYNKESHKQKPHTHTPNKSASGCLELEYAIASDYEQFLKMNSSVADVENMAIAVTNLINSDYDTDYFADEIQFIIVEQYVSTNPSADLWTSGTPPDIYELLDDFTAWGEAGGFSFNYDLATLWTGHDLSGFTVGLAWIGAVCTSNKYNILENFSDDLNQKRVAASHEIGHNFSAEHDPEGSQTIMAPAVGDVTAWSSQSIASIEQFYATRSCLSSCQAGGCTLSLSANVNHQSSPNINNGSIQVNATGGQLPLTFSWSTGESSSNIQNLSPGSYTVTVTDANNCEEISTFEIDAFVCTLSSGVSKSNESVLGLNDGYAIASATGGSLPYTYQWSNGSNSNQISSLNPGNYSITITDANGCSTQENINIAAGPCNLQISTSTQNPSSPTATDGNTNVTIVSGIGPYTFLWSNNQTTNSISELPTGAYTVTVTDINGCTASESVTLQADIIACALTVDISTNDASGFGLSDGSATASILGGTAPFNIVWSNAQSGISIQNLSSGSYSVTVTDANNCQDVQSFEIQEPQSPQNNLLTEVSNPICGSEISVFTTIECSPISGATQYAWEVSNDSIGFLEEYTRAIPNTEFRLEWLQSALMENTHYDIRVKNKTNNGWSAYGNTCSLFLPFSNPSSIHEFENQPKITIVRETSNMLKISSLNRLEIIKIYTISGQLIREIVPKNKTSIYIPLKQNQTYIMSIFSKDKWYNTKVF